MLPQVGDFFSYLGVFLEYTWWFWAYLFLWPLFRSTWRFWREELYVHNERMEAFVPTMFEIKIPRETLMSPKAMEQVLTAIHALKNEPGDLEEWWIDGEVNDWHSLEIVSLGGEVHLYVRVTRQVRNKLVQAAFFAFYPDVEIIEVEDYVSRLPSSMAELHAQGYDLWGAELMLQREDAYPIKLYSDFESPDENKQYDPVSALIEILAKAHKEQIAAIQILIAPIGSEWVHHYHDLVEKLSKRKDESHPTSFASSMNFKAGPMPAVGGDAHGEDMGGKFFKSFLRSPGETEVLEAVEKNLSKPAFETVIRFIYLSPQPLFDDTFPRRGITGAFNQYAATDLNSFKRNDKVATRVKIFDFPYIFPNIRKEYRKARMLYNYRGRNMPPETFMGKLMTSYFMNWNFGTKPFHLTTQCLATIFHPPTAMVLTGPHIKRMDSKKAGPPAGLAIFGEETEIERYQ
jgi:hypothetical protein